MTNAAQYLLVNEYKSEKNNSTAIAETLLSRKSNGQKSLYKAIDESSLVEIYAIKNIEEDLNTSREIVGSIKSKLNSDVRRQVLILIETVKDQAESVPTTKYLQLRHIEVPLNVYDDYVAWRKRTIFNHVKKQSTINSFVAYHSLISTEPGVMFLSGFDGKIEDYQAGFNSPEYKGIVKEAGNKYIAGGERGLYTTLYKKVTVG